MTYRDRVSLISAQQPHSTISGQAFLLWGPHCLHLWTRGGHPGPAAASQGWAKSKYTKRYTARLRSVSPQPKSSPRSLQLAGTPDELLSLPGFTFLVYKVGICTYYYLY